MSLRLRVGTRHCSIWTSRISHSPINAPRTQLRLSLFLQNVTDQACAARTIGAAVSWVNAGRVGVVSSAATRLCGPAVDSMPTDPLVQRAGEPLRFRSAEFAHH